MARSHHNKSQVIKYVRIILIFSASLVAYGLLGLVGLDGLFLAPLNIDVGIVEKGALVHRDLTVLNLSFTSARIIVADQCGCAENSPDSVIVTPFTVRNLPADYRISTAEMGKRFRITHLYISHENNIHTVELKTNFTVK